jgi:hypothetical protein
VVPTGDWRWTASFGTARIELRPLPFAHRRTGEEVPMEENRVRTPDEARAGSKEGVVRYVLAAGLVLVVIGFVVAYGVIG